MKQMLAQQEVLFPQLYWSLRSALRPVMAVPCTGLESAIFGRNGALATVTAPKGANDDDDGDFIPSGVEGILGPFVHLMKNISGDSNNSDNNVNRRDILNVGSSDSSCNVTISAKNEDSR